MRNGKPQFVVMPPKFCTESDPDINRGSSNAVAVEAMGTSLWLPGC